MAVFAVFACKAFRRMGHGSANGMRFLGLDELKSLFEKKKDKYAQDYMEQQDAE